MLWQEGQPGGWAFPCRAYPVEQYPCQTKAAAAIMHMIMNNLDPAVAQVIARETAQHCPAETKRETHASCFQALNFEIILDSREVAKLVREVPGPSLGLPQWWHPWL